MLNALIISPYHAQSHKSWAESVVIMCPQFRWRILSMPPRYFNWRIRGNPLALLFEPSYAGAFEDLDLLVVTSMTDLATLKGLCPKLQNTPTVVYFHENQFAYPTTNGNAAARNLEAKLVTLYGALAADAVLFNSNFNQQTCLSGARQMLADFPDHAPQNCVDVIEAKSTVIPVAVLHSIDGLAANPPSGEEANYSPFTMGKQPKNQARNVTTSQEINDRQPLRIVWNHRWEYDKGPERLALIVEKVAQHSLRCEFSIVGQQFRKIPESFGTLRDSYPQLICRFGYIEDEKAYYDLLAENDIVLSTALHDFQGLSILEATRLGCVPLVPDRVAYVENIPNGFRYRSYPADAEMESAEVVSWIEHYIELLKRNALPTPPDLEKFSTTNLAPRYCEVFNALLANGI